MPFTSKAQQRFMFAKHPEVAQEFAAKTPDISALPEHVKKRKKKAAPSDSSRYAAMSKMAAGE